MIRTFFAAAGRIAGVMLLVAACASEAGPERAPQPEDTPAAGPAGSPGGSDQPAPVRNRAATTGAPRDTTVAVTEPTVIAFYHVDRMGTEVESAAFRVSGPSERDLSMFEYHIPRQQSALGALGWRFISLYRADFRAVDSNGTVLGSPEVGDDGSAGYMVVAPGTQARIRYGVLNTDELTAFVRSTP